MPAASPDGKSTAPWKWLLPALSAGVVVAAVVSYGRAGERHAAPGSPYYDKAVREAISSLKSAGAEVDPAGRPPLPDGLTPENSYWCESCKAYHPRDAVPAAAPSPAAASDPAIPPLPAGLSPADHYWCVNCRTYHKRDTPAGQSPAGAWPGVPFRLPDAGAADP